MQLVYLDESGNTGLNLNDPQQPVFVLCALVVAEERWQALEADLRAILDARVPGWKTTDRFEVHASELRRGGGPFSKMPVRDRVALRDQWMMAGRRDGVRLISRSIKKRAYASWLAKTFGQGVMIHPYVAAFALVSRCIDNYLASLAGRPMGMLIADENKEIAVDIEKSISVFREMAGPLRFGRIIEKGFFIESHKSLPLQLCNLFAASVRKGEEAALGGRRPKGTDASGIELAESLRYDDHQHDGNVLEWLAKRHPAAGPAQKVSGQGMTPRVD